jgi:hypothetical protein
MSDLMELLERVKAATGPDRELDVMIGAALNFDVESMAMPFGDYVGLMGVEKTAIQAESHQSILRDGLPRFTSSIDAALALVERKLPGWTVANLSQQDDKTWYCELREGHLTSYSRVAASNVTYGHRPGNLPLAILAALLSALTSGASS